MQLKKIGKLESVKKIKIDNFFYNIYNLKYLENKYSFNLSKIPTVLKIFLENLLCNFDNLVITDCVIRNTIESFLNRKPNSFEIPYFPSRVLMQDFTGIPVILDLASVDEIMNQ